MGSVFVEGFFLQASLIFALGAQNLFVLQSGLKRQHPVIISVTCFLCDLSLIMVGVAGTASVLSEFHQLKIFFGILGIVFMAVYGLHKMRRLHIPEEENIYLGDTVRRSILLSITFSFLNPHAYLDAIVLIGGYSTKYAIVSERIILGLGAAGFSLVWFLTLSYCASIMKPLLQNPQRMRLINSMTGVVLILLAGKLSGEVYGWIESMVNDPNCSVLGACSPSIPLQADATTIVNP
jgi:L-lysine exporter family protein LysE/ArgO